MKKTALVTLSLIALLELSSFLGALVLPGLKQELSAVVSSLVVSLTNEKRAENKLPKLTSNKELTLAAEAKAKDMAARGYFSHITPEGKLPWYFIDKTKYKYSYAGENLAVNFRDSGEVVNAWMNSPTHRGNILKSQFTDIGVATATGTYMGREAEFVVQFFAAPASSVCFYGVFYSC